MASGADAIHALDRELVALARDPRLAAQPAWQEDVAVSPDQMVASLEDERGLASLPAALVDVVAGARRLRARLDAVELVAAAAARERGVTVRELAAATGMSERAGTNRYPRKKATP